MLKRICSRKPGAGTAIFLISMALLSFAFRVYTYSEPLERDLTTYAVIGHELLKGRLLYSDLWDLKPPTIFGVYAVAEWLVGYGLRQILFLNVLASWLSLAGIFFAAYSLSRYLFPRQQLLSYGTQWTCYLACIFWVILGLSYSIQSNQPNSEVFINAAVIWGFAVLTRVPHESGKARYVYLIIASLLFGIASTFKQVVLCIALLLAAAHFLVVLADDNRCAFRKKLVNALIESSLIPAGIPTLWLTVIVYFAATDRMDIFLKSTYEYASFYAGSPIDNITNGTKLSKLMPYFFWFAIPFFIVTLSGTCLGFLSSSFMPKSFFRLEKPKFSRLLNWVYLSALGIGSFFAVSLPGKFFPHYYQLWLPYLTLGTAFGVFEIKTRVAAHFSGNRKILDWVAPLTIMFAVSIMLIELFGEPWIGLKPDKISEKKYGKVFVHCRDMGEEINKKTDPRTSLYHWGNDPGVYFYANRDPIAGVLWSYAIQQGPLKEEFAQRTLTQIQKAPPDYIVVDIFCFLTPSGNAVSKWIKENYRPDPLFAIHGLFVVCTKIPPTENSPPN